MRQIIKDADNCDVLRYSLEIIASDDQKNIEDYTDQEIINEALYVKDKYTDGTWFEYQYLLGEHGKEEQKFAKKEYKDIMKFLLKHSK